MSTILYSPSRPQSVAEVLDAAVRVFRTTLLRCLPYGALAVVASRLQNIYDIAAGRPLRSFGARDPIWWALFVIGTLLAFGFWNATALRQHRTMMGAAAASGTDLRQGLRRAPAAALLLMLSLAAIGVFFLPAFALPQAHRLWAFVLLSVPAAYVAVALSCSWVALLLAEKGVVGSMLYSFRLVWGNWWRVTLVYSVAAVLLLVFCVLCGVLATAVLVPFVGAADIAVFSAVSSALVVVLAAVGIPFYWALLLMVFGDLRARREGLEPERRLAGAAAE